MNSRLMNQIIDIDKKEKKNIKRMNENRINESVFENLSFVLPHFR